MSKPKNYKILVLVISSDTYPSKRNKKSLLKTWVQNIPSNMNVYFYKAGRNTTLKKNNEIILEVGKSTREMSKKNILAFEYVLNNFDFDFIFRTTTTSYVDLSKLKYFIKNNFSNKDHVYCGKIMETNDLQGNKCVYANGAGLIFSRKTLQAIVDQKDKLDYLLWDDVGLGKLLNEVLNISPSGGFRHDIPGNIFKHNTDRNHYHYRCRIDNHYGYPRFLESFLIKYLHDYLTETKTNQNLNRLRSILFEVSKFFYIQYPFWKLFLFTKTILKKMLPKRLFDFIKNKYSAINNKIQLRYFKY